MTKFQNDRAEQLYLESLEGFGPTYGDSVNGPGFIAQVSDNEWVHENSDGFVTVYESESCVFGKADYWVEENFPEIWNYDA